jgi:transcriptional regulator with XRE-family HTH domain
MCMDSESILLDKQRLQSLRKRQQLTQAEVAMLIGVSLRTYSEYENVSKKTRLRPLEIFELARHLNTSISSLWGELPISATVFWRQTSNYALWAKFISTGGFEDVKVNGLPTEDILRKPLLGLIEVFEADLSSVEDKKLSSMLKRQFECEDHVKALANPTLAAPARFLICWVPNLRATPRVDENPQTGEMVEWTEYDWNGHYEAMIDFIGFDLHQAPQQKNYRDIWWDPTIDDEEALHKAHSDALAARHKIVTPDELEQPEITDFGPSARGVECLEADLERHNKALDDAFEASREEEATNENG